jgi:[lysine-biosynthesis-protein LysW]--L-2-aminoadipate ligase
VRFAIVAHRAGETNVGLVSRRWQRFDPLLLSPVEALARLGPGDAALGRLDVRTTLDGVESGLASLSELTRRGISVLNPAGALVSVHDKLVTARILRRAGLPHPVTRPVPPDRPPPDLDFPAVVKPRFGSWGKDVVVCTNRAELERALEEFARRPWFRTHGAIAQELVPPLGHDLRIVVAGGEVIGAIKRVAAPGEWRTNVALGASRLPLTPPPRACALALEAARALGVDLVAVDLLPRGPGNYSVLEVNGAAEFSAEYALGGDVFQSAVDALERSVVGERRRAVGPDERIGEEVVLAPDELRRPVARILAEAPAALPGDP